MSTLIFTGIALAVVVVLTLVVRAKRHAAKKRRLEKSLKDLGSDDEFPWHLNKPEHGVFDEIAHEVKAYERKFAQEDWERDGSIKLTKRKSS